MRVTELTLSLTANDRPEYLKEVLDSWREVDGVEELTTIFNVEPGNEEVAWLCEMADFFRRRIVVVNRHRYGASTNPWYALRRGFSHSDFVIVGEDDSIVSRDVLAFFDFCRRKMLDSPNTFAAVAFRWKSPPAALHLDIGTPICDAISLGRFSPTIWGTNVVQWRERIRDTWDFLYRQKGWDWNFIENIAPGDVCLVPWVSRSQHIGQFGGAHLQPEQFAGFQSNCFEADPHHGQAHRGYVFV